MSKFEYRKVDPREWEGLTASRRGRYLDVTAECQQCGATETIESGVPLPPEKFAKRFKTNGWHLGKHPICPKCRASKKEVEMPDQKPVLRSAPVEPTPKPEPSIAAREKRRLAFIAIEDAYDEQAKRYKPGNSDAIIAKGLGMAENAIATIREEFFGPAAPPEPPEIIELRQQLQTARDQAQEFRAQAEKLVSQASALEGHVTTLTQRLNVICKTNGW